MATASNDHTVIVWDVSNPAQPQPLKTLTNHKDSLRGLPDVAPAAEPARPLTGWVFVVGILLAFGIFVGFARHRRRPARQAKHN